ncbi:hypothetical protein [Antribacter gilvus]|uniref:hypothetical protein n=1 Tax=Antribacter gilvus TaxID=2304675 RepID=UPI000F78AAE5|nr:hypothetical protein [Antribacter gilvus]
MTEDGTVGEAGSTAQPGVLRVAQSAQLRLGSTRVGVMVAGPREGVPTARLLVRADDGRRATVDAVVGDRVDLYDEGELELVAVEGGTTPTEHSAVRVRHLPA